MQDVLKVKGEICEIKDGKIKKIRVGDQIFVLLETQENKSTLKSGRQTTLDEFM
jgi:hypothetical protein